MATTIISNLYPPVIATWMPAFVRYNACRVYFSLSSYNSYNDIKNVQVIVSNQNSSLTALNTSTYPSEIKICSLEQDSSITGDAKYYITISPTDLRGGEFEVGQYYKVQLRFTSNLASDPPSGNGLAQWLSDNQGYFSEWSTVCLIRGIEQPLIYIREFDGAEDSNLITLESTSLTLTGRLYYDINADIEDEYLKYYVVNVYNTDDNDNLVYSSGNIFTNEYYPNEINYVLNYNLDAGTNYQLEFIYYTNSEYTNSETYNFIVFSVYINPINAIITATPEEKNGRIMIEVKGKDSDIYMGTICIRRSSSEDNFTRWDDIHFATIVNQGTLDYIWYDYTAKAGVFYDYCVLEIVNGVRGNIVKISSPVILGLDDMFLTRADMQVKLRYDPSISSYQVTLSESKTDTIGARYPTFRRNGNIAYKQFPISGLIVSYSDIDHLFSSPEEFYGDMASRYEDFNDEYLIPEYKDYIYERYFREKVMKFLYDNDVKLFRSLTEGNVLVKLMNVSFTPNETLGRMIYSFSATAYEVDECNVDNYIKYGILDLGEYNENYEIEYTEHKIGQVFDTIDAGTNVISTIRSNFENGASDGYINTVQSVYGVQIEFQSDPYLIVCGSDGSLTPATAGQYSEDVVYGYIVAINGVNFLVSPRGYFVVDQDTEVTSITFPVETEVCITFGVEIYVTSDTSEVASSTYYYTRLGQLYDMFEPENSITYQIYLKYYLNYEDYFQKLLAVDEVIVEGDPGTVIYLQDSLATGYSRYLIGKTRSLRFYCDDAIISNMYFGGIHLDPMVDETRLTPNVDEYLDTDITATEFPTSPIEHGVYTIGGDRVIYWHGSWYTFTENDDVWCPVEAMVDYVYELERGYY